MTIPAPARSMPARPKIGSRIWWRYRSDVREGFQGWLSATVHDAHNPELIQIGRSEYDRLGAVLSLSEIEWKPYYD